MWTSSRSAAKWTRARFWKRKERGVRIAVLLVLADRAAPRLPGHRVLQLAGGDGYSVEREEEVDLMAFPGMAQCLPRDGQFIPFELSERVRIETVRRLEVGEPEGPAEEAEPVTEDVQRALVVELLHDHVDEIGLEVRAMKCGHLRPELRLRVAYEGEGARGKERAVDVPFFAIALGPATIGAASTRRWTRTPTRLCGYSSAASSIGTGRWCVPVSRSSIVPQTRQEPSAATRLPHIDLAGDSSSDERGPVLLQPLDGSGRFFASSSGDASRLQPLFKELRRSRVARSRVGGNRNRHFPQGGVRRPRKFAKPVRGAHHESIEDHSLTPYRAEGQKEILRCQLGAADPVPKVLGGSASALALSRRSTRGGRRLPL